MGFDKLQTALLGIPQGVIVVLWIGSGALLNSRLPNNSRTLVCMLFMLPTYVSLSLARLLLRVRALTCGTRPNSAQHGRRAGLPPGADGRIRRTVRGRPRAQPLECDLSAGLTRLPLLPQAHLLLPDQQLCVPAPSLGFRGRE